ncbi:NAD-dependent epimerase/dehydratase family protein [Streptomyces sp. NPDC003032]
MRKRPPGGPAPCALRTAEQDRRAAWSVFPEVNQVNLAGRPGAARIAVFGGTGFVGRRVCLVLAGLGHDVLAVSRSGRVPVPGVRPVGLDPVAAGPVETARLLRAERVKAVVNAAGAVWGAGPEEMERANSALVRTLVSAATALPAPPRFIQLGSVHEYGPDRGRLREELVPRPTTPYGATKLAGTEEVLGAARDGRLTGLVLRLANLVGPGAPGESLLGSVLAQLAAARAGGGPALLRLAPLGDRRDFVDADDVALAVASAVRGPVSGEVLNIAGGNSVRVRHLVELCIAEAGLSVRLSEMSAAAPRLRAVGGTQRVDIGRARRLLGWAPSRPLTDSVRLAWRDVVGTRASSSS